MNKWIIALMIFASFVLGMHTAIFLQVYEETRNQAEIQTQGQKNFDWFLDKKEIQP
jgi:ABC-type phosphate transport system permease subunit